MKMFSGGFFCFIIPKILKSGLEYLMYSDLAGYCHDKLIFGYQAITVNAADLE